jgi:hypothetical protein
MQANSTYRKSGPEDRLYDTLCNVYESDNVVRQVAVPGTKWLIDFYIRSIDTYVQLDGAYWHGLDRPIEVIAEHKTKRDVQIHKKWLTDREQDKWFNRMGKLLIRVIDDGACAVDVLPGSLHMGHV